MVVKNTLQHQRSKLFSRFGRYGKDNRQAALESVWDFAPNIQIHIENKKYTIKTAENYIDLEKVLNLRHKVYYEEMLQTTMPGSVDIDQFDCRCDHLMVVEKNSGVCVGTYRLNSSLFTTGYYSSTEFNINNILRLNGNKLELGRACILKEYRTTLSFAMLWKGIGEYVRKTGTRYIFGCSSIKTTDFDYIALLYLYLREKYFSTDSYRVYPKRKYKFRNLSNYVQQHDSISIQEPFLSDKCQFSLLKFYLRSGAEICGEPSLDREFHCTDFFTLLDMIKLDEQVERKFALEC